MEIASIQARFKTYAEENLKTINHPQNRKYVAFTDLESLSDLLFSFLNFEVEESTLQRIKSNFENSFEKIEQFEIGELASAIENLATNFESFLKKIALIKFGDTEYYKGDGHYKPIQKCALGELIDGKNYHYTSTPASPVSRPFASPLVSPSGPAKSILDYVRDLRNSVHSPKTYSRMELVTNSNVVLGAYLIAIESNLQFFRTRFFPEITYLEKIVGNREYIKLTRHYVDLVGKEEKFSFENIAIEKLDGRSLINSLDALYEDDEDEKAPDENEHEVARVDSVQNIAKDTGMFIIIGEPGSGKTTSLQKIGYENAVGILQNVPGSRLPVFIKASSYSQQDSFEELIAKQVDFMSIEELMERQKLLILVDGLNEIEDEYKRVGLKELAQLTAKYEEADFIFTSRKFGFINVIDLPVFELKKLNEAQVRQLLVNVLQQDKGEELWIQLQANKHMLELASNPLLLTMIIAVASKMNYEIPPNRGLLYKLFNEAILVREQRHYQTDITTKKDVLAYVAFWMRNNGIFKKIKKVKAKELIEEKLSIIDRSLGVNELLNELADNNFLIEVNEDLEFYHETQQEYFVALEIQNLFFRNNLQSIDYTHEKWFESILICSDLFTNDYDRQEFFSIIFIGEKSRTPKGLHVLDENDVGKSITLGCKVAFNLKHIYPALFAKAETYLGNYIVMWHYRKSYGTTIFNFDLIINAVASLSSEKIFRQFLFDVRNLQEFFYNEAFDKRLDNDHGAAAFEEKLRRYDKAFIDNLSDFPLLYRILMENKSLFQELHPLSLSIYYNFRYFFGQLLHNSPTVQLVAAFRQTNSLEILKEIGKSDIQFFFDHYYFTKNAKPNKFYEFIFKYHLRNVEAIRYLLEEVKNEQVEMEQRLRILEQLLESHYSLETILLTLKSLVIKNDTIIYFERVKAVLNRIPLSKLKEYGLDGIFTVPTIDKTDLRVEVADMRDVYYILKAAGDNISNDDIQKNIDNIFVNDRNIYVQEVKDGPGLKKTVKVLIVSAVPQEVIKSYEKHANGSSFTIHYRDHRNQPASRRYYTNSLLKAPQGNRLMLVVDDEVFENVKYFRKRSMNIKVVIGQEFKFVLQNINYHQAGIFLKCSIKEWDACGEQKVAQVYRINIDFQKPYNYHRDILQANNAFLAYIRHQAKKPEVATFIRATGMQFRFPLELDRVRLGVVVGKYGMGPTYRILKIGTTSVTMGNFIQSRPDDDIRENDIVVIEDNTNIALAEKWMVTNELFKESYINSYNEAKKEGFIQAIDGPKDFYFRRPFCDFEPVYGMSVRFIPGRNYTKNNSSLPMAYHVQAMPQKIAEVISMTRGTGCQNVYCRDVETGADLYARVFDNTLPGGDVISPGDRYSYNPGEMGFRKQRVYFIALLQPSTLQKTT